MKAQPLLYYDSYLLKFWLHNLKNHFIVWDENIYHHDYIHLHSKVDILNPTQSFSLNCESNKHIFVNKSLIPFKDQNDLFIDAFLSWKCNFWSDMIHISFCFTAWPKKGF